VVRKLQEFVQGGPQGGGASFMLSGAALQHEELVRLYVYYVVYIYVYRASFMLSGAALQHEELVRLYVYYVVYIYIRI